MLDQILADIRKTFDVDFVPLQLDDGQLEVLNINNMQSHLDGLLARHAIHDPLKDLPLWAKVWPGSFVLGRFLRKLEPEGKTMLELGGGCGVLSLVASRYGFRHIVTSDIVNDALQFARANVLRHVVQYPPRGEVFDRNGEYLVQSRECYDLMVISSEIDKRGFDTARLCEVLNLPRVKLERELANARMRPRAPRLVMSYISKEDKLRFDECNFRGFYTVYRTIRSYPRKIGGNLLGDVGEINERQLKMKRYADYRSGDYVGQSGVEKAYEEELRGNELVSRDISAGMVDGVYVIDCRLSLLTDIAREVEIYR